MGVLIKTSNSKHNKIKDDLSDNYTKGSDNYPQTRSQALMLTDHYSKAPTAITNSEGTAFAQNAAKKKKRVIRTKQSQILPRIQRILIRSGGKTKSATGVARRGILSQHALSSLPVMTTTSQVAHPSPPAKQ